jgi:hypothetical protein
MASAVVRYSYQLPEGAWGDIEDEGSIKVPTQDAPLPATVGGGVAPPVAPPAAASAAPQPLSIVEEALPAAAAAPSPHDKMMVKVLGRVYEYNEKKGKYELVSTSSIVEKGADGKPVWLPAECPLKQVALFLWATRNRDEWIWDGVQKTPNMHDLKKKMVYVKGKGHVSLWDALHSDNKKLVSSVFSPRYWDEKTGEFVGYAPVDEEGKFI